MWYCVNCVDIVLLAAALPCLFQWASTQRLQLLPWTYDQAYLSAALVNIAMTGLRCCVRVALTVHRLDAPRLALMLAYRAIFVRMAQARLRL
jgi:hypothetical protein